MKELTEFNKIYLVKYINILGKSQVSKDLQIRSSDVNKIIEELKENGLYDIYYNLSDDEWEKIEKMKKQDILMKYLTKAKANNSKVIKEILEVFNISITETIMRFSLFNYTYWDFKFDYFKEDDYENEEWKEIEKLNYIVSNYGRVKNKKTNKLKSLRNNKFGYQINLWSNGKAKMITISRLVAHYFIRPVKANERVIHIDGRIKNNYYKNLKIVSK